MTQNWVSQKESSLGGIQNEDFGKVWNKKLFMKSWYNSKNLCEYS